MTAIEFMKKQLRKCEINLEKEKERGASEEVLQAIRDKIRFYGEAVGALGRSHGRWLECFEDWRRQMGGDECSNCGFRHYGTSISHYRFCPACGAKMDLEG